MSKERLEEIKDKYMDAEYDFNLNKHDIDWLIDQAKRAEKNAQDLHDMDLQLASEQKRVKELEFENGRLARRLDWKEESNQERESNLEIIIELIKEDKNKIDQQNKRYREALEQIKKEETVTTALPEGQKAYTASGHIARQALEESE